MVDATMAQLQCRTKSDKSAWYHTCGALPVTVPPQKWTMALGSATLGGGNKTQHVDDDESSWSTTHFSHSNISLLSMVAATVENEEKRSLEESDFLGSSSSCQYGREATETVLILGEEVVDGMVALVVVVSSLSSLEVRRASE
jgi:hypothetical protein